MKRKVLSYAADTIIVLLSVLLIFSIYGNIKTKGKEWNIPSVGHVMWLSVLSGSMKPAFNPGDLIIDTKANTEKLKVGDIVTYRKGLFITTHRISKISKDDKGNLTYITKGDNNNTIDEPFVYPSQIIGKYAFRIPLLGFALLYLKGLPGIIIIWVLFLLIIGTEIYKAVRIRKRYNIKGIESTD